MTDKLTNAVDCYLNTYKKVLNKILPDSQQQISRYYEIDCRHLHILNKLKQFEKNGEEFTSADERHIKKLLAESLDLADRKFEISERLMNLVKSNMVKLNTNMENIKINKGCKNKQNKKSKRMLKSVPNYKEIDSDSIDEVVNIETANECSNKKKSKMTKTLNKNIQIKASQNNNLQTLNKKNSDANQNINTPSTQRSKNKRRNSENSNSDSDVQPTYCLCEEISYGNMVCCDNDLCPIEWFHFGCVSLIRKPKGKWYCPKCRGANSKVMKPKKIFFKELKEYNKRKEEDW